MEKYFDQAMKNHLENIQNTSDIREKLNNLIYVENTINFFSKSLRQKVAGILEYVSGADLTSAEIDQESVMMGFENYLPEEDFSQFVSGNLNSIKETESISQKNIHLNNIKRLITTFRKTLNLQMKNEVSKTAVA